MLPTLNALKRKLGGRHISIINRIDYDPDTHQSQLAYCIMIPELNMIAVSTISIDKAAEELLGCYYAKEQRPHLQLVSRSPSSGKP